MLLKTVKTLADIPFKGIELIKTDNAITGLIIAGKVHVRVENYGLKVLVETDGEQVSLHRVTATIPGFPPAIEYFDSEYDAKTKADQFKEAGAEVSRERVDVIVNDQGVVIGLADQATKPSLNDEIPF